MLSLRDSAFEMLGVPVDDDGGEQVRTCHLEVLTFGGPVADFTVASDAQSIFEGMMNLTLVESDLGAARAMSASSS
jgi:hypothetical protein